MDAPPLPEPATFPALLRRNREQYGAAPAVVTADDSISHAELDGASRAVAGRLVAAGVGKGSRVGLLAPNGIDWVVTATAAVRVGAVLVPLSTILRPPELEGQLRVADVTHLVATPRFKGRAYLDELRGIVPGIPTLGAVWPIDGLPTEAATDHLVTALEDAVRPADDLVVLFTSGSTGRPKGTIHTHGGGLRAVAATLDSRRLAPGERLYMPMPLFWTGGFATSLTAALVAGATLLTEAEPEPAGTLAFLARARATIFRGWPDQAAALAAHPDFATVDLSSLGDASTGTLLPADRQPAPGARPNAFGMTETFGPWCGDRVDVDLPAAAWGSCGRPFAGVEVRITDPDTGAELPTGDQGEIWVRGANMMRGICGRERAEVFTADGFLRTGDLGRVDADGYVFFGGRIDDMVKVKGATVYPAEVEAALRALPSVRRAHVTDVAAADGRAEVAALVVTDADLEAIRAAVRDRLSAFKVPTRWLLVPDADLVPMLPTGKVDRAGLRKLLEDQDTEGPHQ